jgi:hypothetical protein
MSIPSDSKVHQEHVDNTGLEASSILIHIQTFFDFKSEQFLEFSSLFIFYDVNFKNPSPLLANHPMMQFAAFEIPRKSRS